MASFFDTFKPVNVAAEKDELGRVVDKVAESVEALPVAAPTVDTTPEPTPEPVVEEEKPSLLSGFKPVRTLESFVPAEEPVEDAQMPSGDPEVSILKDALSRRPGNRTQEVPWLTTPSDESSIMAAGRAGVDALNRLGARKDAKRASRDRLLNQRLMESDERLAPMIMEREAFEADRKEYVNNLLPEQYAPGTYSETDIVEDDELFGIAEEFMKTRYGLQAVEGKSRKELVSSFLDGRRGNYLGNSVNVLSEYDYLNDKKEDWETLDKIGAGYTLYENMAGITSEDVSWSETGGAAADTAWYLLMDPINVVGMGIGRIIGGTASKAGIKSLQHYVMKEVTKRRLAGQAVISTGKVAKDIMRVAATTARTEGTNAVAKFANGIKGTALGKVMSKEGVTEIATATATDAIIASGLEFVYQRNMVTAGAQEEVSTTSVGLAALFGLTVGGIATARVAGRGASGAALPSIDVKKGTHRDAALSFQESMAEHFKAQGKDMAGETSWAQKVGSGKELSVKDTDFFIDLLKGVDPVKDADGVVTKPGLKGIAQVMQEQGFYFQPRDGDDKLTNWIADFLSEFDDKDMKAIVKGFEDSAGVKLTDLGDVTSKSFSDAFAKKISQSAQSMNAVSQVANRLNIDAADLNMDLFIQEALGQNLLVGAKTGDAKFGAAVADKWGRYMPSTTKITEGQNQFIRSLVSHPSTSSLNVFGYAISSSMGSASDLLRASFMMTGGSVKRALGMKEAGVEMERIADAIIGANMNRAKLLLDPDMTAAAYRSVLEKNSGALEALHKVQAGGIDVDKTIGDVIGQGPVGKVMDNYIDTVQGLTFVKSQDILTKSQEYVFQMDKALRITFGKSWNEFYTSPDANKLMATKEFKMLEEGAVAKTLEHTFGKSYKGSGVLGEVAGVIEDARSIPGLGMMVPFGRFFNNTIDFASKNSPIGLVAKGMFDKYPDKTMAELVTNNMVAGGLIYSMMGGEDKARKQGLGLYDTVNEEGEVESMQYDYPMSLFKAAARYFSYKEAGEAVPEEIVTQIGTDFFGGGLTRNLEQSGSALVDGVALMLQGDIDQGKDTLQEGVGAIGAQLIGGFTRSLEPVDTLVGIAFNKDMAPKNVKDGNAFVGKAFTYMETTIELFTGKPIADVSKSSAEGDRKQQTTKNLGTRNVQLTNTLRVMNMLGYESWDNNASFKVSKLAAEAGNEYNGAFFNRIDKVAERMMSSEIFRNSPIKDQRILWEEELAVVRKRARADLSTNYAGEQSTLSAQYELTERNTIGALKAALYDLGYDGKTIGDLDQAELDIVKTYIETQALNEELALPRGSY